VSVGSDSPNLNLSSVMRPLLIDSSSKLKSGARRRVLHIEYAASMRTGDGLEVAVA